MADLEPEPARAAEELQPARPAPGPAPAAPAAPQAPGRTASGGLKLAAVVVFAAGIASTAMIQRMRHSPPPAAPVQEVSAPQPAPVPYQTPAAQPRPASPAAPEAASPLPFWGGEEKVVAVAGGDEDLAPFTEKVDASAGGGGDGLVPYEELRKQAAQALAPDTAAAPAALGAAPPCAAGACRAGGISGRMGLYRRGNIMTNVPYIRFMGKCGNEYVQQITNYRRSTMMKVSNNRGEVWTLNLKPGQSATIKARYPAGEYTFQFWRR